MKDIYLFGSFNCDFTIRAPYLPQAGETLKGSDFMMTAGGKGANQAYACAALGGSVKMAGVVGRDPFGDLLLESLKKVGVDLRFVRREGCSTGVALITVINGDNRIILDEGANARCSKQDADNLLKEAKEGDIFLTQLETPFPAVRHALKTAKEKGLFVVLNPAPARDEAREFLKECDLVTPNESELALLSGTNNVEEGCERLLAMGAKAVLVTLGKQGSYYYSGQRKFRVDCVNVGKTVDTTGAGDTYCGALCVKLAEGSDIEEAAKFASLCSGIAVTRRGAQVAIPTRSEADRVWKSME